MGTPDKKLSELVDIVRSWIPRRVKPSNVSRDFWMPDNSCRVCYECDSQFTVFNRRHHCRLCGRVFCAKCTANSIPAPTDEPKIGREDIERIRVCNYCFKQWEQEGVAAVEDGIYVPSPGLSPSPSATSLASTKSSCTCNSSNSTVGSIPYSTGPYQRVTYSCGLSPCQSAEMDPDTVEQDNIASVGPTNPSVDTGDVASDKFGFCINSVRSDDENDGYSAHRSDSETRHFSQSDDYYGAVNLSEADRSHGLHKVHPTENNGDTKSMNSSPLAEHFSADVVEEIKRNGEEAEEHQHDHSDECETPLYDVEGRDAEPVDFEKNGLLWDPPEPEDEEDEREAVLFDDDDGDDGGTGEWGYLRSSNSFGSRELRGRDKSSEEHKKAIKNVVEGHFRALVAQLLQVENLPVGDQDDKESWLEIITSLSWEAATLLKPDMSKGGGMDPGGYVKVKCIACGRPSESMVVRGVVCKKNVAHRRMISKIDKPRFLILGGALEYQRVSNLLSSFDTLLQQEMDHLKMAVAKIDSHHPSVLLVEKSVSRYAQEYLLAKDISLVLNIKTPLLERIARCTGAQIVPSIDHLTSQKLGYCDTFHVEKFFEAHGSAGQGGKKLTKTLMFFEGCPRPLGCTILLKGASGDELKQVKHVVQYGIFAAYHLALETSFLADEGASLPELPLKSPITVALPDKPSSIDRSISTIPGFTASITGKHSNPQLMHELQKSNKDLISNGSSSSPVDPICKMEEAEPACLSKGSTYTEPAINSIGSSDTINSWFPSGLDFPVSYCNESPSDRDSKETDNKLVPKEYFGSKTADNKEAVINDDLTLYSFGTLEAFGQSPGSAYLGTSEFTVLEQDSKNLNEEMGSIKEEFPSSPSDHQSILVSLSTRCVLKGTVCERAHLLRIKYYGNFDKPLGRYLRDHLFDQSFHCHSCDMPSEAHVHCHTHRQGSLTISVKKFGEFTLPGEREGKIWMWHRCLRCPRTNGFPPTTKRVVMSDAAWGLSFGKFLELSFSNHAAASRVASCGHSLHRDCLRFYGFGRMVACFRYASIDVHSVCLPPSKLDFNHDYQDWVQTEVNEVLEKEERLFSEVYNAIHRIFSGKESGVGGPQDSGRRASETRCCITELEGILQKEKEEFTEASQKVLKSGQPAVDILEINRLRRQLIFLSYVWDKRLRHVANSYKNILIDCSPKTSPKLTEKLTESDMGSKMGKGSNRSNSLPNGGKAGQITKHVSDMDLDMNPRKETDPSLSSIADNRDKLPSEDGNPERRVLSEGDFQNITNLSDTLDAAWIGESSPPSMTAKDDGFSSSDPSIMQSTAAGNSDVENCSLGKGVDLACSPGLEDPNSLEKSKILEGMPYMNLYSSLNKYTVLNYQKLGLGEYNPIYINSLRDLERQSGARLLLPVGVNDTVVPVYDDEPTSIISYALVSSDYHAQMSEPERLKESGELASSFSSTSLFDSVTLMPLHSPDEIGFDSIRSQGSVDETILSTTGSRNSQAVDPFLYTKDLHARVSIVDEGPLGKVKYTVTCYYAKRFEALRRICCPSEMEYIRSLSRCKKWGAQGGKSNVFFAKTLDDRFIIKQVTKTELESFIKFASAYFKYLLESISTKSPTCLAKILGIYQVSKQLKGGKETKMDVLVMENLLFRRNIVRLYDLKGSSRSRYNPDTSGSNKVLLDQNLIEAMPTSPIFVGNKAKRLLERAVWNDTSFLASIDVMDYSLLVGVDEEKHELVLGIIDFMRQYTWDKHLETWVKTSGILGGPKNTAPTVISPQQYKKRFRKAMTAYFLMVPDQWSPPRIIPSTSQSDLNDENAQGGANLDSCYEMKSVNAKM